MAKRRDITEAVFNQVESVVTGTNFTIEYDDSTTESLSFDSSQISRYDPDDEEKSPAVFIDVGQSNPRNFNDATRAPNHVEYNSDGTVNYVEWAEYVEQEFFITSRGNHLASEEPVYSRLRRNFGQYTSGYRNRSDLHDDVQNIDIDSTVPADSTSLDDAIWGDQIQLYLTYKKSYIVESGGEYTFDETVDLIGTIVQIDLTVDSDLDLADGEGFTYTVN